MAFLIYRIPATGSLQALFNIFQCCCYCLFAMTNTGLIGGLVTLINMTASPRDWELCKRFDGPLRASVRTHKSA